MKQSTMLHKVGNLVPALLMIFFSIPKLLGAEQAKEIFKQFEAFVPINLDVFRILTGVVELSIGVLLILYAIKGKYKYGQLGYFLLFATMAGALTMELFAKSKPDMMMAILAAILFSLSIYKLIILIKK